MTDHEFSALAELLRLRGGLSETAARQVLIEGLMPSEAARRTGMTQQAVNNVLVRCRRGLQLARIAAGHGSQD